METLRPAERVGTRSAEKAPRPWAPTAVWRALVPGSSQWSWGQRERGMVLFGSYGSAAVSAAFTWGTPMGLGLLLFAFGVHVVSTVDALRQSAFPTLGKWAPWLTAALWLGCGVYAPLLATASVVAWPGVRGGLTPEGYLVNCWAYCVREPGRGDWVWFHSSPWGDPRLGKVVAESGQDVEWAENRLLVDGGAVNLPAPSRSSWPPRAVSYKVPEGHVLINPEGDQRATEGLVIVDRGQVVGRAWARYYPVLERRLLD